MSLAELNTGCFKGQGAVVNLENAETEPAGRPRRAYIISLPLSHTAEPPSLKEMLCCGQSICGKLRPDLICAAEIEHCLIRWPGCRYCFIPSETDRPNETRRNEESREEQGGDQTVTGMSN